MQASLRSVFPGACAALLLICLAGCPTHPHGPESPPAKAAVAPPAPGSPQAPGHTTSPREPRHEGRPYDVESRGSLLTILAFRGGALAKAGHNHVIASHDLSGTFYLPDEVLRTTFELHVPVAQLTIDEPEFRAQEGPDFPVEVPESAKEGTRRNMLSEALLSGTQYPDITLVSERIDRDATGATVRAEVQVRIRSQTHTVSVPVAYSLAKDELTATGELAIKQTELGLTPFSAMLGALQVQDELRIKFRIVARQAQTHH